MGFLFLGLLCQASVWCLHCLCSTFHLLLYRLFTVRWGRVLETYIKNRGIFYKNVYLILFLEHNA